MTRYVIGPDVALRLAQERLALQGHRLIAPTLLRSQLLTALYAAVRAGEMGRDDASGHLDHVRALRIRLLGDRVLQGVAWTLADELGWPATYDAEYLALTRLQADAFVTLDPALARAASAVVPVAPFEVLLTRA